MEYRRLGNSGVQVSVLSFGSWLTFGKQIEDNTAKNLLAKAYEGGVNFFDNAEIYAKGESERVMGKYLKEFNWDRSTYLVSSKVFFGRGGQLPNQRGLSRKHVIEACNEALQRLQVDYLDLFFCHRPDKNTPIVETVWTMHNLIQQGKILYWGTSEWSAQEITAAYAVAAQHNLIAPTMEQPQYNMFHRKRVEVEYNELYKNFGLGATIWSPLASGLLTGKYNDGMAENTRLTIEGLEWLKDRTLAEDRINKCKKLASIAAELNTSMAKLAIAWCAKNPNVSTVILGASKVSQLEETLQALDLLEMLSPEAMNKIDEVLENKPEFPPF